MIIACHTERRWDALCEAIVSATDQKPRPKAVVVAVDHNQSLYDRLLKHCSASVQVVENHYERGASGTRNSGAEVARTPLMAFLDDDARASDAWLAQLLEPFDDPLVVGSGGSVAAAWLGGPPRWFPEEFGWVVGASFRGQPTALTHVRNVWSENMAIRREVFEAIGGFRVGFGKVGSRSRPEDTDLCMRAAKSVAGGVWIYVPGAVVHHRVGAERTTVPFFVGRSFSEGRGKVELSRLHRGSGDFDPERTYLQRTLPLAVARYLGTGLRKRSTPSIEKGCMLLLGVAAAGIGAALATASANHAEPRRTRIADDADPVSAPGRILPWAYMKAPCLRVDVDLKDVLPEVILPGPKRATCAWVLVRNNWTPLAALLVEIPRTGLTRAELAVAIEVTLESETPRKAELGDTPPGVRDRLQSGEREPITVVICTRDRPAGLEACLRSLLTQSYSNFKVLVIDNAPTTNQSWAVVASFPKAFVQYAVEPQPGLARARNRALTLLSGGIVAWLDDDEIADEHWLAEIARTFSEHPEADGLSGAMLPAQLDTAAQVWFEQFGGHNKHRGFRATTFSAKTHMQNPLYPLPPFGTGGNMAFKWRSLIELGGFNVALGAGTPAMGAEDTRAFTDILRRGGTIIYQPSAITYHYHRQTTEDLTRQMFGYGVGLTAFYASLVIDAPACLPRLLMLVPRAANDFLGRQGLRTGSLPRDFPRELLAANRRGLVAGPWRYLKGRLLGGVSPLSVASTRGGGEMKTRNDGAKGANDGLAMPPVLVTVVDLADEVPTLHRERPGGGTYNGVWALVLDDGSPVATIRAPFTEGAISGEELLERLGGRTIASRAKEESKARRSAEIGTKASRTDRELPFATVVVPTTFSRLEQLKQCVEGLSGLDYPAFEVIVVDNRPERPGGQGEREQLARLPNVRVLTEPVPGASAARNRGIADATGSFIAFTDDDALPEPTWLRRLGERFASEPGTTGISGLVIPKELESWIQIWFEVSGLLIDQNLNRCSYRLARADGRKQEKESWGWRRRFVVTKDCGDEIEEHSLYMLGGYGMGCNFAFRRDFLLLIGGFEEALGAGTPARGGEDILVLLEVLVTGGTLAYEPTAIVSHTHRRTYEELREQVFGYGVGLTAAFTALARKDLRHLVGYGLVALPAARSVFFPASGKAASRSADYPSELTRLELLGMLKGPVAYWQSWLRYSRVGSVGRGVAL